MKDYALYLFDLDGTLIHTIDLIVECFHHSLGTVAGRRVPDQEIKAHVGLPLKEQFKVYLGDLDEGTYQRLMKVHMDYQMSHWKGQIHAYTGVKEVLEGLRAKGKPMGIVTSRKIKTAELYLESLGLMKYFSHLVTPELTEKHKPHPEPVLKALELFGAVAGDTIYIGDAPFDIESGNSAGCDTALIQREHLVNYEGEEPNYYLKGLNDLLSE